MQRETDEASFNTLIGNTSGIHGREVEGTDSQETRNEDEYFCFQSDSNTVMQRIHSSHRKQQVFVAYRVAEILDTTDVSQWKHVSGINNPADTGTRAINIEELKRSEWLTGSASLERPESERPEQVHLIFA